MNTAVGLSAVLAVCAGAAYGAEISYSAPLNASFETGGNIGVDLPWFDPSIGELVGVSLAWRLAPSAHVRVENTLPREAEFQGFFEIVLTAAAPFGAGIPPTSFAVPLGPVTLGASDGMAWQGADYTDFGRQVQEQVFETSPLSPDLYVGEGTFGCLVSVQRVSLLADPGFVSLINEGYLAGDVTVTYTYVPSPAGAGLLLGGMASFRRRRTS